MKSTSGILRSTDPSSCPRATVYSSREPGVTRKFTLNSPPSKSGTQVKPSVGMMSIDATMEAAATPTTVLRWSRPHASPRG